MPRKEWQAAAARWLEESSHKRSLIDEKTHLRWIAPFLKQLCLSDISTDVIEAIAKKKESTGVSPASVNRMLEVVRAILRKARKEWGWLEVVPAVRMRKEESRRIRWNEGIFLFAGPKKNKFGGAILNQSKEKY